MREEITDAAILFTVYLPELKGYKTIMLTADSHADCYGTAANMFPMRYYFDDCIEGFWTSAHRFLDRYEAKDLALENGQLKEDTDMRPLYSEDLW